MTFSVRRMEKWDLPQVSAIDREAFPTQWPPANYHQELNNRLAHYIVVHDDTRKNTPTDHSKPRHGLSRFIPWLRRSTDGGKSSDLSSQYIVGFSGIWLLIDEAHITNIAVRQDYQGRGIGELLLIATLDLSRQLKAKIVTLEVRASNIVAQSLYSKYGFNTTGTRRGYYLDNREDAIIMSTEDIDSTSFQEQLERLREALSRKLVQPMTARATES